MDKYTKRLIAVCVIYFSIIGGIGYSLRVQPATKYNYAEWVYITNGFYKGQHGQIISDRCGVVFKTTDSQYEYLVDIQGVSGGVCIPEEDLVYPEFTGPNG